MSRVVVCTGLGVVSPLGIGAQKSWSALLSAKSGVTRLKDQDTFEGSQSRVAAYVPDEEYHTAITKHNYIVRNFKQLSRATIFALLAADEALCQAHLLDKSGQLIERYRARTGVAIGQGMIDFQSIYENALLVNGGNFRRMSPYFITKALINISSGNVSIRYKLNGPNHSVSTACATGAHSIGDALKFIQSGQADIMVCGSTEASINPIAMAGFERMRALCTGFDENPSKASRPFDASRSGFVMGEGAGVLILETFEHAISRGLREQDIICSVLGYGSSADGYHLTAPDPNGLGAKLSMHSALKDSKLSPHQVTHINAHATSTPIGDEIECQAIEETFFSGDKKPERLFVTSCKSSFGHLLGGAGSVESIFAMLTCRDGIIPPCLNLENPLKTRNIEFVKEKPIDWELNERILMKNSFGFGGTNASIVIGNINK